jgi:hypothetical protein
MRLTVVLSLLALVPAAVAQPLGPGDVPPTLRPWIPWAMHGSEQMACPRLHGSEDAPGCVFVGRLQLEASPKGARFRQEVELFARDAVPLPGDAEHWPLDVRDGASPVAVVEHDGAPAVFLGPGTHVLTGAFRWDSLPAALGGPGQASLVELTLGGSRVAHPERDEEGRLFLRRPERRPATRTGSRSGAAEADRRRAVAPHHPHRPRRRGKAREVVLGRALPAGFTRCSSRPARRARGAGARLRVQLRPGKWVFTLVARSESPPAAVPRPDPGGP